jgi:predicted transcriptional regulator
VAKIKRKRYRSRNEIIAAILQVAFEGSLRTNIMYQAFLSFNQLSKEYLPLLLENGLLEYDTKDQKYRTTRKGKEFLDVYDQLKL